MGLNKLWPFKTRHQSDAVKEPTHHLTISFETDGIFYGVEPELVDWPNQWQCFGQDSASISLLNQLEELGHVTPLANQIFLNWYSLYQLLAGETGNTDELLSLLILPEFTDFRPSLTSQNSLEDLDFRITLSDWVNTQGHKLLTPPDVTGALIQWQNQRFLLAEAVWRLVREVRAFYALPKDNRTPQTNRQSWSLILNVQVFISC